MWHFQSIWGIPALLSMIWSFVIVIILPHTSLLSWTLTWWQEWYSMCVLMLATYQWNLTDYDCCGISSPLLGTWLSLYRGKLVCSLIDGWLSWTCVLAWCPCDLHVLHKSYNSIQPTRQTTTVSLQWGLKLTPVTSYICGCQETWLNFIKSHYRSWLTNN